MCGLTGFISSDCQDEQALRSTCAQMMAALRHRGPDSEGMWIDPRQGLALGHRRLAIQDLSHSGHQPMVSLCGRFVLVFNGEIYNHTDLRKALSARQLPWRGHSDTETLVEAIATWGLPDTLKRCHGMFALAVWDRQARTLSLARDRFGEKPLYYQADGQRLLFASELRALELHPAFQGRISRAALHHYFDRGYINGPLSIFEQVHKLPPGTFLTHHADTGLQGEPVPYWSIASPLAQAATPVHGDACAVIEPLLREAVARQLISDVPLGAFLSGGIDSSLVAALMQELSDKPINTFTIGFEQTAYDEAGPARRMASHLGTHHTEVYVSEGNLLDLVPTLPQVYDEPFADASQVPTVLLCQIARRHVTVALSGDGADELFGGYRRYTDGPSLLRLTRPIPAFLRRRLGEHLADLPAAWLARLPLGLSDLAEKTGKVAALLSMQDVNALYHHLTTHRWPYGLPLATEGRVDSAGSQMVTPPLAQMDLTRQMMWRDISTYLPDDILVKVDRAAMASSLETRAPFLDPQLAEAAWQLPTAELIQGRRGKLVLRRILEKRVPSRMLAPSKRGFTPPVGDWLRGPLKPWAEALLDPGLLRRQGVLDARITRRMWDEHQCGRRSWAYQLWDILMFQAWLNRPGRRAVPS